MKVGNLVTLRQAHGELVGMLGVIISIDKITASKRGVPFQFIKVYFANSTNFRTLIVHSDNLEVMSEGR
jgi:hypothetical protein